MIVVLTGFIPMISSSQNLTWKAPPYTDTLKNPIVFNEAALSDAKKIYNDICWTCHGLEGKGDGPVSIALSPKPADHTLDEVQQQKDGNIFWKISMGNGAMQPYGKILTAKERWELVNFIRSLANKK